MKDFKSYSENGNGGNANNGSAGSGNTFENNKGMNFVNEIVNQMRGKSQGEIMRAVIAQAEQGKRNGTLTNADIDNFYAAVAPTLDGFKRRKLKEIVERLKRI